VTTSQLLTTGVDVPTCKNVAIVRVINSMVEFKQIIGRGTRVRDDYGKFFFNILDYTGSATRLFSDPEFDGEPALISEEEIDEEGEITSQTYQEVGEEIGDTQEERDVRPIISDDFEGERRKYYFDGGQVEIAAHLVYELDPDGKQLRVIKFTDYAAEKVRTLCPSLVELRNQWADADLRSAIISKLEERGIDFDELRAATQQSEADPFDLLCYVAFNAPIRSRRERAERLRKEKRDFFERYGPEAKAVLNELLEKYAEHGTAQFLIPDILKVPPISDRGNVLEIARFFGGSEKLKEAVSELQALLYAA
ncbi:MAG: type I restriction-modification enzyme R subunit C-terminal domain-containing protein, partial [Candidatus Binatia bacterium]